MATRDTETETGDAGRPGPEAGAVLTAVLLLLVSAGFVGVSLYVSTSSRAGNAMMKLVALLGGGVLGVAGIYILYTEVWRDDVDRR